DVGHEHRIRGCRFRQLAQQPGRVNRLSLVRLTAPDFRGPGALPLLDQIPANRINRVGSQGAKLTHELMERGLRVTDDPDVDGINLPNLLRIDINLAPRGWGHGER